MSQAYFYDNKPGAEYLPHKGSPVTPEVLASLGAQIIPVPKEGHEARLKAIAAERGYPANAKLSTQTSTGPGASAERFYLDEVLWYTLQSGGFVDYKDLDDKWIRVPLTANTVYIIPAGLYSRYVSTDKGLTGLALSKGQSSTVDRNGAEADNHPVHRSFLSRLGK
ncbi:hypothetical protein L218DRAFT_961370 [Marasmius fiardii PR-910]|nr:hypothetical protein L218DRAFT_961370 [Marasmius fiardii PR-910]